MAEVSLVGNSGAALNDVLQPVAYDMGALFNSFTSHISDFPSPSVSFNSQAFPETSNYNGPASSIRLNQELSIHPLSARVSIPPRSYQLTNMETGEIITITKESSGRYRTELKLDGLIQYASDNQLGYSFATVTFKPGLGLTTDERDKYRTAFLDKLRKVFKKAGLPMKYAWVFSVQFDRRLSGDEAATPFHFLFASPVGTLPDQQPVIGPDGRKRWKTLTEGTLLTMADLKSIWVDQTGRNLGTVNCGTVRDLPSTRAYIIQNEREAEAFHISRRHRFGGSQLGIYGCSNGLRRKVKKALEDERKTNPELNYNSFRRKNGTVWMRVVKGGQVIHETVVRSSWTTDPETWLERQQANSSPRGTQQRPSNTVAPNQDASMPEVLDAIPMGSPIDIPTATACTKRTPSTAHDFQKDGTCSTFQPATEISAHVNGAVADKLISQDSIQSCAYSKGTELSTVPDNSVHSACHIHSHSPVLRAKHTCHFSFKKKPVVQAFPCSPREASFANDIAGDGSEPAKITKIYDVFAAPTTVYPDGYIRPILFPQNSRLGNAQ